MNRKQLRAGFLLLIFLLLGYGLYRIFFPFLTPLFWAGVLALVFFPAYRRLAQWLGHRRGIAAIIFTAAVVLALILPAFYLSWILVDESVRFYRSFRDFVQAGGMIALVEHPWLDRLIRLWEGLDAQLQALNIDLRTVSLRGAEAATKLLARWLGSAAVNIIALLANLLLMAVALFFLFRDGEHLLLWLRGSIPLRTEETEVIFSRLEGTITAVVRGALLTAGIQGLLAGAGLWVTGVPFPVLLGFLAMLCALLPLGGSALVWGPAALYLALSGSWVKGIVLAGWGALVVSTVDNLLRPILIGGRADLHAGLLFFGILGGLAVFGFSGLVLGPAVVALFLTCVELSAKPEAPTEGP